MTTDKKKNTKQAIALGASAVVMVFAALGINSCTTEPPARPDAKTVTSTQSTTATETDTKTKTKTKTSTPPERTVTETKAARSAERDSSPNPSTTNSVPEETTAEEVPESAETNEPSESPTTSEEPEIVEESAETEDAPEQDSSSKWDALAECEAGGDWSINTGNGFSGGIQATPETWEAFGGTEYAPTAGQATKSQQIEVGERILAEQGPGAWPVCSGKVGLN